MNQLKKLMGSSMMTVVFLVILLISAGRLDFWQAWIYAGISFLMNIATLFVLSGNDELLKERSKPGVGAQKWDKVILGIGLLLTLAILITAGLDSGRYHGSPNLPWSLSLVGAALNLLGMILFLSAMRENRFFSAVARIQQERQQSVCTSGPYKIVRHPGYTGMIVGTLGFPLLFVSVWAIIPTVLSVINLVIRTALEDRFLANNLNGYREYQKMTQFRLIPGIW